MPQFLVKWVISLGKDVMSNRILERGEGRQPWALGMQRRQWGGDSLAVLCVDLGHSAGGIDDFEQKGKVEGKRIWMFLGCFSAKFFKEWPNLEWQYNQNQDKSDSGEDMFWKGTQEIQSEIQL